MLNALRRAQWCYTLCYISATYSLTYLHKMVLNWSNRCNCFINARWKSRKASMFFLSLHTVTQKRAKWSIISEWRQTMFDQHRRAINSNTLWILISSLICTHQPCRCSVQWQTSVWRHHSQYNNLSTRSACLSGVYKSTDNLSDTWQSHLSTMTSVHFEDVAFWSELCIYIRPTEVNS